MTNLTAKEKIIETITSTFWDDLFFIEYLNNLTFHRKAELKRQLQNQSNQNNNGETK